MISGPNALFSDSWVFVQHTKCDKLLSFDRVAAQATLQRCMNVDCKCRFTSPQRKRTELNSLNQLRQFELASQAPIPPFCPGTFHGCDFLKWTLQLYLLNLTKGAKFAGLRWTSNDQNAFSFRGGLRPLTRGSAPGPRWGLCPQTPIMGSCSALAMVPLSQPLTPSRRLWVQLNFAPVPQTESRRLWLALMAAHITVNWSILPETHLVVAEEQLWSKRRHQRRESGSRKSPETGNLLQRIQLRGDWGNTGLHGTVRLVCTA